MKKTILILSVFLCFSLYAEKQDNEFANYFELLDQYPHALGPIGNYKEGEIQIVRDPAKMREIAQKTGRQIGVIYKDRYWIWINDAVQFPNGNTGVYGRMVWQSSLKGPPGVAVMAIMPDKKVVLNCNYRHATRSWELELPRGARNPDETFQDCARREVREETGKLVDDLHFLGDVAPDTGMTNTVAPVYLATVVKEEESSPEDSEAIAEIISLSVEELKKAFQKGSITLTVNGKPQKVFVRDAFLAFALFKAELGGYLK